MRIVVGSGSSRDVKEAELDRHLEIMSEFIGRIEARADEPRELTMILRSASSGPAQALILKARDLARTGIAAKVVVAHLDPEDDVRKLYACLSQLKPRGRTHELIRWARDRGAIVVEDDYDAEFRYDRAAIGALQGLAPERVVYVGGASKTVTPALRLGWMALPPQLVRPVEREKRFDDMGSPLLEQHAFARFMGSGDLSRHLRRVRPIYRDRRDALVTALAELLTEARWRGPAAGLHLHVLLPPGLDERALARAAYQSELQLEDAAWHWADPSQAPPSVVLGFGTLPEPAIRRSVAVLAELVDRLLRRSG